MRKSSKETVRTVLRRRGEAGDSVAKELRESCRTPVFMSSALRKNIA